MNATRFWLAALLLVGGAVETSAQPINTDWEQSQAAFRTTLEAARREGELTIAAVTSNTVPPSRIALFRKLFGIDVKLVVLPAAQSFARISADKASGKLSFDVRMSGFDHESYQLRTLGHVAPFGDLPNEFDPAATWIKGFEPKRGDATSLIYRAVGWSIIVNDDLLPEAQAPKSWHDLANPAYRNKIIFYDPGVDGIGCTVFHSLMGRYGRDWALDLLRNITTVTRVPYISERQVARGEFAIGAPIISSTMASLLEIPEPRPFHLMHPTDGVIGNPSAVTLLKGAQHPNAAKVWANFLLSREGQQDEADLIGGGPIRPDVTPKNAEYALLLRDPIFPGFPVAEDFTFSRDCPGSLPPLLKEAGVQWRQ